MKKVIFFDFFGVISSEVAIKFFNSRFDKELASKIKEKIFVRADRGEISEEESYKLIALETNEEVKIIKEEWENLPKIDSNMVNFILELKKDHQIYLLSNAIGSYLRKLLNKYDLYKCFDKIFISSEIKLIKPNKDFFEFVISDLNLNPNDCIMIDDNSRNIEGAKSIGINGIVYKNLDQLKNEIKSIENL